MSIFKSEKFQKIFYPIFYLVFTVAITISGCFIFQRYYYTNIFVSGSSMLPTLVGGENSKNIHHYGIADTSDNAINGLNRFDVVIANFPSSWGTGQGGLVVKRIWGFPGESISLHTTSEVINEKTVYTSTFAVRRGEEEIYTVTAHDITRTVDLIYKKEEMTLFEFNTGKKVFNTNTKELRNFNINLGSDEYFVMGDNWGNSSDSYKNISSADKLTRKYIKGKVVCIQGYAEVEREPGTDNYIITTKYPSKARYIF